jgi:hypothetical protein
METKIAKVPDKRKIIRMEKEDVAMDIRNGAEAEQEIERHPVPDRFNYHKEGESRSESFLNLYDGSERSTSLELYKDWMQNVSNVKANQLAEQVRYTCIASLKQRAFPADRI